MCSQQQPHQMATLIFPILAALWVVAALSSSGEGLYVSRHAARILPQRIVTISAPEAGDARILSFAEGRVDAGTKLAVLNDDILTMEERELELSIRQQRLERDKAVHKLSKSREELEFIRNLPQQRRGYVEEHLKTSVDEELLSAIDEEIALLNEKFKLAEDRLRQAAEKKRRASTLVMPFDGRIRYHIPLPDREGASVTIPSSVPVLTAIDDSAYYIVLAAGNPNWTKLEHERLQLTVNLGSGHSLRARWHHQIVEKGERGESLFYYFRLPEQDSERAFSLLGTNIVAELYYDCDKDWLYERKSDLAAEMGATPIETWEKLVETLRPGYGIVFIGETHLCLRKRDDSASLPLPVPAP